MFSLRIYSIEKRPLIAEGSPSNHHHEHSFNSKFHETRGIIHLYRNISHHPQQSLPARRSTLLFVIAIPNRMSTEDFLHFCGSYVDSILEIHVIRNDGMDDLYSMLIRLDDKKSADNFYCSLSGRHFSSTEAEVCHILFTASVEYTKSAKIASTPPTGSTELPTCPVCIERLDQDTSGIPTTHHSFQCSCISKWTDSSCRVCRFCQQQREKPTCSVCETSENLWICVICGFVGCGRYNGRHALRHWKDTQHCYSLDLETQRVWDYVGNSYVHRLNQSKADGKLVELNSHCTSIGDDYGTCEYSEDSGIGGALFSSKADAIVDEYNNLLASQLENQRQYYESLLVEAKGKREKSIAEAVEKALDSKLHNIQLKLEKCIEEKAFGSNIMAARIMCSFGGELEFENKRYSYMGGTSKQMTLCLETTFKELRSRIYNIIKSRPEDCDMRMKVLNPCTNESMPPIEIEDDDDVREFLSYQFEHSDKFFPLVIETMQHINTTTYVDTVAEEYAMEFKYNPSPLQVVVSNDQLHELPQTSNVMTIQINENLMKNQDLWRKKMKEIEEREKAALRLRDEKIVDLEDKIRDLMVYIEAQKTLDNMTDADDIKGGTLLPIPLHQSPSSNAKKPAKTNQRRN